MDDPLARFQKLQQAHAISDQAEQNSRKGLQSYQAFSLIDKTEKTTRLQIRRVTGLTHSASYSCLLDVCYDGHLGTELILIFNFMQVKIKGKNLQTLITAIEKHECAFLQDYDAQVFVAPKADEVLIESIEVIEKY